jgi:hypothetical protein
MSLLFEEDDEGSITGAQVDFQGTAFSVSRVDES